MLGLKEPQEPYGFRRLTETRPDLSAQKSSYQGCGETRAFVYPNLLFQAPSGCCFSSIPWTDLCSIGNVSRMSRILAQALSSPIHCQVEDGTHIQPQLQEGWGIVAHGLHSGLGEVPLSGHLGCDTSASATERVGYGK